MHASKNGKTMTVQSQESKDAYRLQLESEQRYAIGELPELREENNSEQNQVILSYISEHFGLKETEISLIFGDFIREHSPVVAKKIKQIWEENRSMEWSSKDSNFRSWDRIRIWDRTIQCNGKLSDGKICGHSISRTPASNNRDLWIRAKKILIQLLENDEEKAGELMKPHANATIREINFKRFRDIVGNHCGVMSVFNHELEDSFDETELFNMFHANRDVYRAMLYLNYCSSEETSCPKCGKDLWMTTVSLGSKEEDSVYFESMAEHALKALITGLLGSSLTHPNKSFTGTLVDFTLPEQAPLPSDIVLPEEAELIRSIRQGDMDQYLHAIVEHQIDIGEPNSFIRSTAEKRKSGKIVIQSGLVNESTFAKKRHKAAVAEAFQASLYVAGQEGHILVMPNGEKLQFELFENSTILDLNLLSMKAINLMATELVKFKPLMFFTDDKKGYPANNQLRWAKKLAAQILLVIVDLKTMIKVKKISPDHLNLEEKKYSHDMWMIEFRTEFKNNLINRFSNLRSQQDSTYEKDLIDNFTIDRVDPMYVPPLDRTLNPIEGGFITKNAQLKNPLIQNNASESLFNIKRFEPSQKAIDNLNILQQTSWSINEYVGIISRELLKQRIKEMIGKFQISKSEFGYQLNYSDPFPDFSLSQVREWICSMWLAHDILENNSGEFWHAWCFDWRGRMYTCSNLLSPQGDDLARGLLQFSEGLPLDETGWKWLRRAIGRSYLKRSIEKSSAFTDGEKTLWNQIQSEMKSKNWKSIDAVFSNERMCSLMHKVLKLVIEDPISAFSVWGEGDIFKKKAEGFQRLALTEAYVTAIEEYEDGNLNPIVSIPVVLDASSNIYQHASCLAQDPEMALAVNVLPNENKLPTDIYQKVADKVAEMWEKENPFTSIGLTDSEMKEVMKFALKRDAAKKPVMTIGYGSERFAIVPTFLTHNGQDGGIHEWAMFRTSDKSELTKDEEYELKSKYPEDSDKKERDKIAKSRMIAHPNSVLGKIRDNISRGNHHDIARIIVASYIKAINEVLKGHSVLKTSLKNVRTMVANSKQSKDYVCWELNDGSKIRNIVFEKMEDDTTDPWKGTRAYGEKIYRFTIKLHSDKRNPGKEESGLPPNFVHSIDACHMRAFIENFSQETSSKSIWSVHDAFGSHPNHIDQLSKIVIKTFFETHETSNGVSHLHSLIQNTLKSCKPPTGTKELIKSFNKALDELTTINENLINRASKVVLDSGTASDYDDVYLIS